jgi:hypothetical protein
MKFYVVSCVKEGLQIVEAESMEAKGARIRFTTRKGNREFRRQEVQFWEECQTLENAEAVRAEFEQDWMGRHLTSLPDSLRG